MFVTSLAQDFYKIKWEGLQSFMTQVILSSIVQMLILGNHLSNRSEIPILDAIYVKSVNCKICNLPERKQNFVMRLASFV